MILFKGMERTWRGYLMCEPIQIIYDVEALEGTVM